jgi:hypothetical protein
MPEPETHPSKGYDTIGLFDFKDRRPEQTEYVFHCNFETVPGLSAKDLDGGGTSKDGKSSTPPSMAGTLSIALTTNAPLGRGDYDKPNGDMPNYGAVWIEDPTQRYVKTLELWTGTYGFVMNTYNDRRRGCKSDIIDTLTSATLHDHSSHALKWTGMNVKGEPVSQGPYVLWVEVETDERLPKPPPVSYAFQAGKTPWTQQLPPMPGATSLILTYTPRP